MRLFSWYFDEFMEILKDRDLFIVERRASDYCIMSLSQWRCMAMAIFPMIRSVSPLFSPLLFLSSSLPLDGQLNRGITEKNIALRSFASFFSLFLLFQFKCIYAHAINFGNIRWERNIAGFIGGLGSRHAMELLIFHVWPFFFFFLNRNIIETVKKIVARRYAPSIFKK